MRLFLTESQLTILRREWSALFDQEILSVESVAPLLGGAEQDIAGIKIPVYRHIDDENITGIGGALGAITSNSRLLSFRILSKLGMEYLDHYGVPVQSFVLDSRWTMALPKILAYIRPPTCPTVGYGTTFVTAILLKTDSEVGPSGLPSGKMNAIPLSGLFPATIVVEPTNASYSAMSEGLKNILSTTRVGDPLFTDANYLQRWLPLRDSTNLSDSVRASLHTYMDNQYSLVMPFNLEEEVSCDH